MGDLLRVIGEWIHYLFPMRVVLSYEMGVRFIGGQTPKQLKPGIYFFVPFFMLVEITSAAQDVLDLPIQSLTTKDGHKVTLSMNVTYRVVDAVAHWTRVEDFNDSLSRMATRHIMAKVRAWTYPELLLHQRDLETSVRETMGTRLSKLGWGVEIDDAGLTDLVEAKPYRVIQNA